MSHAKHGSRRRQWKERIGWISSEDGSVDIVWRIDGTAFVQVSWPYGRKSYIAELPPGQITISEKNRIAEKVNTEMQRRTSATKAQQTTTEAILCQWSIDYPHLHEFLTATKYDDGSARAPGTMTCFTAMEGGVRACLSDKDTGEIAFQQAESFSELFRRCEAGIATGSLDWRTGGKPQKRK